MFIQRKRNIERITIVLVFIIRKLFAKLLIDINRIRINPGNVFSL